MPLNRTICIILILVSFSLKAAAQDNNIMHRYEDHFEVAEEKQHFHVHTDHSNEVKTLTSFLFLFYKEFISSQDVESCVFKPSCSVYTIESIKKKGFVVGAMAAMDRMTRCNGLAYGYYPIDEETNLNIDPVE